MNTPSTGLPVRARAAVGDRRRDRLGLGHERRNEDGDHAVDLRRRGGALRGRGGSGPAAPRRACRRDCRRSPRPAETIAARRASLSPSAGSCRPCASQASAARIPGPPALVRMATPRAARHRLVREQGRDVEQLLEPLGPDDAGLPEQGVDDGVARRQRAGVRGRGARPGVRAAGLDRDDRLGAADAPGDLAELLRVAEALEVEQDDRRCADRRPSTESDRCPRRRPCCRPRRSSRCRCRAASRSRGSRGPARRSASTSRRRPAGGYTGENVAFRRTAGSVLSRPMQLGPISRQPAVPDLVDAGAPRARARRRRTR